MRDCLNEFAGAGEWTLNPGDGAFYGPKIDVKVTDAIGRSHQAATVQLDFQMPERFNLQYTASDGSFARPVMVHRAMLGSVERMIAILIEHYAGKWPFWLSPRQAIILPIDADLNEYAETVARQLHGAGFHAEANVGKERCAVGKEREDRTARCPNRPDARPGTRERCAMRSSRSTTLS